MYINFDFPPLLYYIRSNPDYFSPGMTHMARNEIDFFDLLVVFEGALHIWEDGEKFDVKEKEFLILEPYKKHYGYKPSKENTHYYWLHFQVTGPYHLTPEENPSFNIATDDIHTLSIPKHGKLLKTHAIYEHFKELTNLHTYSNSLFKHQQQIIFHQLIHQIMSQTKKAIKSSSPSQQVALIAEETVHFLEKNFSENITYETLSNHLNFNCTYISRCFKKIYGITPLDYLKKIRLKEAEFDLIHSDRTIEKIAMDVGFNSNSYFSRTFSQEFGVSPSQYRNRVNKANPIIASKSTVQS